jgi:hypothetical protein
MTTTHPYTHWAYFTAEEDAHHCAETLTRADYLCCVDPPGFDPLTVDRPAEPSATEWTLRAAGPEHLQPGDIRARHSNVEAIVRQHGGHYDGGETGWMAPEQAAQWTASEER